MVELLLRGFDDDDDDEGGKGSESLKKKWLQHTHHQEHDWLFSSILEICRTLERTFSNGWSTYFNFKSMYQLIFVAAVAATVYTNGLSFVFQ